MEIYTPRLVLREFTDDDWRAMLAYQSDPRYLRFYAWESRTEEQVRAFAQQFIAWQHEQPRVKFQLVITREGKLIGNVGVRLTRRATREAELGYELDPAYWGQGYAIEAASALRDWGFREWNLHRLTARCLAENVASVRVLEKLGLRLEGRLREREFFKGRWWDELLYAQLEREWRR